MTLQPAPAPEGTVAQPPPNFNGFVIGTNVVGDTIHINTAQVVLILVGPEYNTWVMTTGHDLRIVSVTEGPP